MKEITWGVSLLNCFSCYQYENTNYFLCECKGYNLFLHWNNNWGLFVIPGIKNGKLPFHGCHQTTLQFEDTLLGKVFNSHKKCDIKMLAKEIWRQGEKRYHFATADYVRHEHCSNANKRSAGEKDGTTLNLWRAREEVSIHKARCDRDIARKLPSRQPHDACHDSWTGKLDR